MLELLSQVSKLDRIAKLFLASQFLRALYFAWPIWYGFATLSLSPVQVGIYFSVLAAVQVFAEIPTGAFADRYGRKVSALTGAFLLILLPLVMYFGHSFPAYILCAFLAGIGGAFISGSLEALLYDHENVSKETFRTILWLEITVFQTGLIVGAISGGFLYDLHPSLPFVAEAIACFICLLVISQMTEVKSRVSTEMHSYLSYFKDGIRFLLASKFLIVVVVMGVSSAVAVNASIEFINEAAMIEYGLAPSERGLLIGGVKVFALIIINLVMLRFLRKDRSRLLFTAFMGSSIFALLSFSSFPLFIAGYAAFNLISATQATFIKPILHDNLPSSHRATAISSYYAIIGLVTFGCSWFFGFLVQYFQTPRATYMLFAVVFVALITPCALWIAQHLKANPVRA